MRPLFFLVAIVISISFASAIDWSNTVAYWNFDEGTGTEARDLVDGLYNGTLVSDMGWAIGKLGNATNSTDAGDYINVTTPPLNGETQSTVSAWIYIRSTPNSNTCNAAAGNGVCAQILDAHNNTVNINGIFEFGIDSDLRVRFGKSYLGSPSANIVNRSNGAISLNIWKHIAVTTNGTNRSFYIDGVLDTSILGNATTFGRHTGLAIGIDRNGNGRFDGLIDELGIWNVALNAIDISQLYNGGSGLAFGTQPSNPLTINLLSPTNNQIFSVRNVTFIANLTPPTNTIPTSNLTNATLYVYNSSGAVINQTRNLLTGNVMNSTNWSLVNFELGHYKYNVFGCATNGTVNCNFASENISFTIGATISSESHTGTVFETSKQQFNISILLTSGSTLTLAQLVYNGTNYTVSDIVRGGNNYNMSRTIDIPKNPNAWANTTRNFFWRFQFSNAQSASQETTVRQQNVSFINLQICNTTYPTSGINYTTRDENTTAIINSIYETTVNYWLGSGTEQKNYSTNFSTSVQSAYNFCIFPINQTFKVDQDASFTAPNYVDRTHYLRNASIRNDSKVVDLFLLQSAFATKFFITAQEGVSALANAIITIDKYYVGEGIFKTIGIRKSDSAGKFIEYLEIDNDYRLTITKDGVNYGITEKNAHCPEAPCNFIIFANPSASNIFSTYYDEFATSINSNISFNATSGIVSYNFIDLTGLANYFQLIVKKVQSNQSNLVVCDQTLNSVSGTITCNMSGQTGDFLAEGIINRSPNKIDKILGFTIGEIKQALGLIAIFISLAIVVTMVFAGGAVSRGNPVVVIAFFMVAIVGLKLMGIFPFSWVFVSVICLISIVIIGWIKT